jgi:hypothetical protein
MIESPRDLLTAPRLDHLDNVIFIERILLFPTPGTAVDGPNEA